MRVTRQRLLKCGFRRLRSASSQYTLLLRGAFASPGVIGNMIHQSGAEMAKKANTRKHEASPHGIGNPTKTSIARPTVNGLILYSSLRIHEADRANCYRLGSSSTRSCSAILESTIPSIMQEHAATSCITHSHSITNNLGKASSPKQVFMRLIPSRG